MDSEHNHETRLYDILNVYSRSRATGSIQLNLTEIQQLGKAWRSDGLDSVYLGLSHRTSNANVGNLNGNRMFYNNDYMVNSLCPKLDDC